MAVCSECNNKVDRSDPEKLKCSLCNNFYHSGCLAMSPNDLEFIKSKEFSWKCNKCLNARKSINNSHAQINSPKSNYFAAKNSINLSEISLNSPKNTIETSTLDSINNNIQLLFKMLNETKSSLLNEIKNEIRDIKDSLMSTISDLKIENEYLKSEIKNINNKLDSHEQLSLNDCVDIVGLPQISTDNLFTTVKEIFSEHLNVEINNNEIIQCYQKNIQSANSPSTYENESKINYVIRVKFNCSETKNKIMRAKHVLRRKKLSIYNIKNEKVDVICFINHTLTTQRRKLYKQALSVKKNNNVKFLWIKNGFIFMRKDEKSNKKNILDISDLVSFKN